MEQNQEGQPVQDKRSGGGTESPIPNDQERSNGTQGVGGDQPHSNAEVLDELKRGERWMIYLTGAIAFFALGSMVASISQCASMKTQAKIMADQLESMKTTGNDTKALAIATQNQSYAAQYTALANLMQAMQAIRFANAAKTSADNSDRIARGSEDAVKTAQASMRLDQRARVVVQGGKGGKYLPTRGTEAYAGIIQPSEVHIDLVFSNNGKTLAADVQLCAAIIYVAHGGKQPPTFSLHRGFDDDCVSMSSALTGVAMVNDEGVSEGVSLVQRHLVGPMHPGEPIQYTLLWRGAKSGEPTRIADSLARPEIDAIEHQQAFFVITARLLYRDDFGKRHDTLYCARWQPPSDQLLKLPYGNDEN